MNTDKPGLPSALSNANPIATPSIKTNGPPAAIPPATPLRPATPIAIKSTLGANASAAFGPTAGARADLIYGTSGSTKTTQLGYVADYIKAKYGLNSRLISADSGGWEPIQALVDDGVLDAFALIQHRTHIYETMEKLCLGWWPENPKDPQSKLIPPSQNGLANVGALLIEGLTSWCDIMMRTNVTDMKNINVPRSATEKENLLRSGEFEHRFSSQTDYGSIQDVIAEFVRDSGMLPVKKVVWTSLEQKGEDDQKKPVYGPDIIGRKATGKCGPWFGNFIHLDFINTMVKVKDPINPSITIDMLKPKPFMFLRSHVDPNDPFKLPWPAKTRASRNFYQEVPDIMEPRMDKFYTVIDGLLEKEKAQRQAQKDAK